MAAYVREDDGSLRKLGPDEEVPDYAMRNGFFLVPDEPAEPAPPWTGWPDGWVQVGATTDG